MFIPTNEQGVVFLFGQVIGGTGFELLRIGSAFPDALIRKSGVEYRTEFEFLASNFKLHRHDPILCDVIVCWIDDFPDSILPVLCMKDGEWATKEIILPSSEQREIAHWKYRALSAEQSNRLLRDSRPASGVDEIGVPTRFEASAKKLHGQMNGEAFGRRDVERILTVGRTKADGIIKSGLSLGLWTPTSNDKYIAVHD